MSRLMAWSVMKSASYVCIERVITRYRAFCYVQAYAPIQSARVSIERLARRIDVPTTFGVGVRESALGLGVWHGQKPPRIAAAALSEHLSRQHLISPHLTGQHANLRLTNNPNPKTPDQYGNSTLLLRRSLPRYLHPSHHLDHSAQALAKLTHRHQFPSSS